MTERGDKAGGSGWEAGTHVHTLRHTHVHSRTLTGTRTYAHSHAHMHMHAQVPRRTHARVHTSMHRHTWTRSHAHTCTDTSHKHMRTFTHVCTRAPAHTRHSHALTHVHMRADMRQHTQMHTRVRKHRLTCTHRHIHAHAHTHTRTHAGHATGDAALRQRQSWVSLLGCSVGRFGHHGRAGCRGGGWRAAGPPRQMPSGLLRRWAQKHLCLFCAATAARTRPPAYDRDIHTRSVGQQARTPPVR